MDFQQLKELIYFLQSTNVSQISVQHGEFKVDIKMKDHLSVSSGMVVSPTTYAAPPMQMLQQQMPVMQVVSSQPSDVAAPVQQAVAPKEEAPAAKEEKKEDTTKYIEIKSPMVGTFYRSPAPDKPVFVKVGDTISPNSPVCLIEAMKLFNEVKAEVSGRIVKVLVEDCSPVEYEQVLFLVDPA